MKTKIEYAYILQWSKKIKAIELLGGKCEECGEIKPWLLQFHHKNPNQKEFDITHIKTYRWSILEKEIKKCKLVCSNCHRKITTKTNERILPKNILLEYVGYKFCSICKNDNIILLDFHHIDPNTKELKISFETRNDNYNSIIDIDNNVKKELDKCQILCSNCHHDLHFNKERFEKYKDEIYNWNYKEQQKPIDKELVLKMYNEGKKQVEIRKELNCAKSTICGIIKKYMD